MTQSILDRNQDLALEAERDAIEKARREGGYVDRLMSDAWKGWPSQIDGVETLLARKLGPVRHIAGLEIMDPKPPRRRRRYFRHLFATSDPAQPFLYVFTKTNVGRGGDKFEQLETFVGEVDDPEFRAPVYHGLLHLAGRLREGRVGVWEAVSGRPLDTLNGSHEDLCAMVRTIGAINSLTDTAAARVPGLGPAKEREPVAEMMPVALANFAARGLETGPIQAEVDRIVELEDGARAASTLGRQFFSHMDIGHGNVVFDGETQKTIVLDWDAACLAPAGASLLAMTSLSEAVQKDLAQYYVDFMLARGIELDLRDILFTARSTRFLRMIRRCVLRSGAGTGARMDPESDTLRQYFDASSEESFRWCVAHIDYLER